jgi:hypothetical protein
VPFIVAGAEQYEAQFKRPDLVARALRGEAVGGN